MALTASRAWLAIRLAAWGLLGLLGLWLGAAIKMYWVIAVFLGIALLGSALELPPRRSSRVTFVQAGIVTGVLFAMAAIAAIAGAAIIADELHGVPHRPWRVYPRLIYDPVRDAFGSPGGAFFWVLCFGACLGMGIRYLRKLLGKDGTNAT